MLKKIILIAAIVLLISLSIGCKQELKLPQIVPADKINQIKAVINNITGQVQEPEQAINTTPKTEEKEDTYTAITKPESDVWFNTEDGFKLSGTMYFKDRKYPVVIMLHMLYNDRYTWLPLIERMKNDNFNILVFDFRGHGQSTQYKDKNITTDDLENYDFQQMILDVKAAKAFLEWNGFENFILVGASTGANTALNYAAADKDIRKIALISPGLNYRGINTEEAAKKYDGKLLIITSEKDRTSYEASNKIYEWSPSRDKRFKVYPEIKQHGTNIFEVKKDSIELIYSFVKYY